MIGYDLNLDVPHASHQLFEENRWVSEGFEGFGTGAREGLGEVAPGRHPADSMTTTSSSSFNQHGIAEFFGLEISIIKRLYRPPAPTSYRHARLLCKPLGGYFVADETHHATRWTYEDKAHFATKFSELGVLGYEAPSHPHRFGA